MEYLAVYYKKLSVPPPNSLLQIEVLCADRIEEMKNLLAAIPPSLSQLYSGVSGPSRSSIRW